MEEHGRKKKKEHRGTGRVMNPNHQGICFRETEINKHENNCSQHLASRTKNYQERETPITADREKIYVCEKEGHRERVIFGKCKH